MRCQALHESLSVVARLPSPPVQLDGGVEVFGNRLGGHSSHLQERLPADDRCRTTPEDTIVAVLARQDDLEEHALVVPARLEVLKRVVVGEIVRRLNDGHLGIVEVTDRRSEDVRLRDVVGVEDQQQLAVQDLEGVVDVPGLGMAVVGARQVAGAGVLGQTPDGLTTTVVEHPGDVGVGDTCATQERGLQHVETLVVRADDHIHAVWTADRRALRCRYPPREEAECSSITQPKSSQANSSVNNTGSVLCQVSMIRQPR